MTQARTVEHFEAMASAVFAPLRIRPLEPGPFAAGFRSASAGEVVVSRIRGRPCRVGRLPALIGAGDRELVKVTVQTAGSMCVE
ncbi:AraC-like ligand-binding domain-containing protein [Amycolatopsis pithecellobii]|uniref:Transcription regulator HTH AraC- type ligand binding domain-containing protein n=1 Tax=Amycolatopsis pithecellobii TaxID=664692 RepID=A0A6N7Z509_9PSEU|nr:hypothetical protein [Amycolatopsis pithecellobii]MTD56599.1 hypothetical protein [Amycolatopsis pithecellobii]